MESQTPILGMKNSQLNMESQTPILGMKNSQLIPEFGQVKVPSDVVNASDSKDFMKPDSFIATPHLIRWDSRQHCAPRESDVGDSEPLFSNKNRNAAVIHI